MVETSTQDKHTRQAPLVCRLDAGYSEGMTDKETVSNPAADAVLQELAAAKVLIAAMNVDQKFLEEKIEKLEDEIESLDNIIEDITNRGR